MASASASRDTLIEVLVLVLPSADLDMDVPACPTGADVVAEGGRCLNESLMPRITLLFVVVRAM
jgi:hypothetical protein